jgi:hypothetical protein
MPTSILISLFAIIAHNGNDACQFGWDRLQGNPHGHGLPCRRHVFRRFRRLFTHGTSCVVTGQFFKTMPMNGMAAGHFVGGVGRRAKKHWTSTGYVNIQINPTKMLQNGSKVDRQATSCIGNRKREKETNQL